MTFFKDNREKSIESLQFSFFLKEIYFSLLDENDSKNSQIQEFINVVGKNYDWQSYQIQNYVTSLRDHIFWKSSGIYLENMQKFVSHECNAFDFACTVYLLIRNNLKESDDLIEYFEKQTTVELTSKNFQFSTVIHDFEELLETFIFDPTTNVTEDELREIVKGVLPKIQKYFID